MELWGWVPWAFPTVPPCDDLREGAHKLPVPVGVGHSQEVDGFKFLESVYGAYKNGVTERLEEKRFCVVEFPVCCVRVVDVGCFTRVKNCQKKGLSFSLFTLDSNTTTATATAISNVLIDCET